MSDNATHRRSGEPAVTQTPPAPSEGAAEPKPAKQRRAPAPIDPETQAMRRIESVLLVLQESDPTAPHRVLEYLIARRKSRAMFGLHTTDSDYPNAGP